MVRNVLEYFLELFEPVLDIASRLCGHTAKLGISDHTFATNMNLLPFSVFREQLDMEALVAILFWGIHIVHHTSRLFLESVSQKRIQIEACVLFRSLLTVREDNLDIMTIRYVLEVYLFLDHLAPDTIRHTIFYFYLCLKLILI